ncbi:MAG: FAD-dependent oxidoreductase, partial [Candidatus Puniceispirillum sp.]|nr:FAD-dependent oxidoreductase [Candidatus Puniceispirillum sp.]
NAPFARRLVNAGRLSLPCQLGHSSLTKNDTDDFDVQMTVGAPCLDAPLVTKNGDHAWLMNQLGNRFTLLVIGTPLCKAPDDIHCIHIAADADFNDVEGLVNKRYGTGIYLIRPDQHVAARWLSDKVTSVDISAALARACAQSAI